MLTWARVAPNITSIEKRDRGRRMPSLVPGGDTEARQQKARRKMQHPIYFETSGCNTCNISLKVDKILETCI
jgi:hypothetical protein